MGYHAQIRPVSLQDAYKCQLSYNYKCQLKHLSVLLFISENDFSTVKMKLKVRLAQNFGFSFLVILFFLGLIQYCAVYVGLFDIWRDVILEVGILILEIVEFYFFLLRDEMMDVSQLSFDDNVLLMLDEPQRNQFVFVNQETND